ncbi:hypothetical protein SCLCIDRAFT_1132716 [Scleroderma citrinum Foug A]|uniref:Uncharacterized protein n=1 Tax=Scleroderma citrinum Foug A TaxID=1036808 RepID=A0A0C3D9Z8_9AGAM|nr:hypothetical protein SCLCIDRAFT_1132716 [Scleroderma citrinum Foug A]
MCADPRAGPPGPIWYVRKSGVPFKHEADNTKVVDQVKRTVSSEDPPRVYTLHFVFIMNINANDCRLVEGRYRIMVNNQRVFVDHDNVMADNGPPQIATVGHYSLTYFVVNCYHVTSVSTSADTAKKTATAPMLFTTKQRRSTPSILRVGSPSIWSTSAKGPPLAPLDTGQSPGMATITPSRQYPLRMVGLHQEVGARSPSQT